MITALVRRDPATRMALWLVPVACMTTLPLVFMLQLDGTGSTSTLSVLALLVPWLAGLSTIRVRLRSTELGLALPISGPTLAAARMTALALYVLLPAMASLVVLALVVLATAAPLSAAGVAMGLVVSVASAMLVALLLVQSLSPGLSEVPVGPGLAGAALAGVMALATALLVPGPGLSLLFLAAGAGLAAWTYRSVPPSLERTAPGSSERSGRVGRVTMRGGVDGLVLGQLDWSLPLTLALLLVWVISSGLSASLVFVLMVPYFVTTELAQGLSRIAWADPLPLSRRRLLAYVSMPALIAVLGGTVAGDWLRRLSPPRPSVRFEHECFDTLRVGAGLVCHEQVQVPAQHWRVAMGTPPTVSSPWGEEALPPAHPVFWGAPVSIYNPYAVDEGSSRRFVALQMSRAIRDVYGRAIAPEEIARRYLRINASGRVVLAGDGLTVEESYRLPLPPRRNTGVLALVCVLGWAASVAAALWIGPGPRPRRPLFRQLLPWVVVLGVLSAVLLFDLQVGEWIFAEVLAGLRRLLPSGRSAAAFVVAAVGGVLFLLLGRLFARVELKPAAGEASRPKPLWRGWLPVVAAPVVFVLFVLVMGLDAHASTGSVWGVRVLLLLGADANAVDGRGETALHSAAYSGRSRVARLLLDHGARADVRGKDGRTALHMASSSDNPEDRLGTFAALLDGGADPNARDADGVTPLMDAVYYERTRALRLLVARGADLEARDKWGRTPLLEAVAESRTDSVRALLDLGARLDAVDDSGETVRQAAARRGDAEILALLSAREGHSVAPAPSAPR